MSAIAIENVSKRFRGKGLFKSVLALDQISLTVSKGDVFGFLGPNGAGKTSLIKILVGLMQPDAGSCKIMGCDSGTTEAKLKVGYLPESPYFHQFLTATEFLEFHGKLLGLERKELRERIRSLLSKMRLSKSADQPLKTFSKGMLQRVGFAQALLHDPEILILDEPMTGLDPVGRREIRDIINQVALSGKTVFFSTHIIHDVEVICTTVGFITEGKLRGSGNIESLLGKTVKSMEVRYGFPYGKEPSDLDVISASRKTMDGWVIDIETSADKLEEDVNQVIKKIQNHKGIIRSVVPRKNTLEDLFFIK